MDVNEKEHHDDSKSLNYEYENFHNHNEDNRSEDTSIFKHNQKYSGNFFRGRGRGRFVTNQKRNENETFSQIHKKENKSAIYGNYAFYYGYRNQFTPDERLKYFKKEMFENKDVLDIGCNTGQLTLSLAKNFAPKMIIGLDIDAELIRTAKKNTKHYLTDDVEYKSDLPVSCISQFGPMALASIGKCDVGFPFNICFVQGNYVFESSTLLEMEEPKFDVILCLSITKWIQLNWGDDGLILAFRRMFAQLRGGGCLILEPQPLKSYYKSKKLSDVHQKSFAEMKLLPDQYKDYLLNVIGFKRCDLINDAKGELADVKGFQRPMYLFTKEDSGPKLSKHVIFNSDSDNSSNCSDMDEDELSD